MKKPTILFALFFTTSLVLPETNQSLKYISLGLDEIPFTLGKNLTTSKNEQHLCQGDVMTEAYSQNQTILPSIQPTETVFVSWNRYSTIYALFVKFSALNLGISAKERTPT